MRIAIATIAVFAAASAAFAHDVDPTKLPLGDGKLSSVPQGRLNSGPATPTPAAAARAMPGRGSTRPPAPST